VPPNGGCSQEGGGPAVALTRGWRKKDKFASMADRIFEGLDKKTERKVKMSKRNGAPLSE